EAVAAAVALAPVYGLLRWAEASPEGIGEGAGPWVVLAVLGLALSLFWSLQPGVYAVLRGWVDEVGARVVYREGDGGAAATSPAKPGAGQARAQVGGPLRTLSAAVFGAALLALSWLAMGRLMTWVAGERAGWLRW